MSKGRRFDKIIQDAVNSGKIEIPIGELELHNGDIRWKSNKTIASIDNYLKPIISKALQSGQNTISTSVIQQKAPTSDWSGTISNAAGRYFEYVFANRLAEEAEIRGATANLAITNQFAAQANYSMDLPQELMFTIEDVATKAAEAALKDNLFGSQVDIQSLAGSNPTGDIVLYMDRDTPITFELKFLKNMGDSLKYFELSDANFTGHRTFPVFLKEEKNQRNRFWHYERKKGWRSQNTQTWTENLRTNGLKAYITRELSKGKKKSSQLLTYLLQKGDSSVNLSSKKIVIGANNDPMHPIITVDLQALLKDLQKKGDIKGVMNKYSYGFYLQIKGSKQQQSLARLEANKEDIEAHSQENYNGKQTQDPWTHTTWLFYLNKAFYGG